VTVVQTTKSSPSRLSNEKRPRGDAETSDIANEMARKDIINCIFATRDEARTSVGKKAIVELAGFVKKERLYVQGKECESNDE